MTNKLLLTIFLSALFVFVNSSSVYTSSPSKKTKTPKKLLEQVLMENDPENYAKYKNNKNKISNLVKVRKVDLNSDKKYEYLILGNSPFVCGSGGCSLWIYRKEPNTNNYQSIEPISGEDVSLRGSLDKNINVLHTTTNGYFDLECFERSFQTTTKVVLKFDGTRYARVLDK